MGKTIRGGVACRRRRSGYTLIELTVAVMVLTITLGAICTSLLTTVSLSQTNHETGIGLDAVRSRIEEMRGEEFQELFQRYNATTLDDPVTGVSPGANFDVPSLTLRNNDPDGFVGAIQFPVIGGELREDFVDAELGMPRDLNSDGNIDALDHAGDYTVLPVRVELEWLGPTTSQRIELVTTISRRDDP